MDGYFWQIANSADMIIWFIRIKSKTIKEKPNFRLGFWQNVSFYRVGDWGDVYIDLHVGLHVFFRVQFAGIIPVFLEFNE